MFKPQTSQDESGNLLKPREGSQWETGIKSSLRDGLLNTRATLFLMKDDNIAAQAYDDQGIAITNTYWATGKVETQGVELEASGYLSQNWMVMAGYTFTDIEEKAGDHNPKFDTIPVTPSPLDRLPPGRLGAGAAPRGRDDGGERLRLQPEGVETHQGAMPCSMRRCVTRSTTECRRP